MSWTFVKCFLNIYITINVFWNITWLCEREKKGQNVGYNVKLMIITPLLKLCQFVELLNKLLLLLYFITSGCKVCEWWQFMTCCNTNINLNEYGTLDLSCKENLTTWAPHAKALKKVKKTYFLSE